jgi:LacI family transcriptional regulator
MKRIAILVETSLASGRQIVTGISRFLDERTDWSVFQHSGPLGAMDPAALSQWQGDGIIARVANEELLSLIQAKQLPTVDVLGNVRPQPFHLVKCNDQAIGASVAKHFKQNAHRDFAFVGLGDERWSLERESGFQQALQVGAEHLHTFHIQQQRADDRPASDSFDRVKAWLAGLPAPIGLMVASDQLAPVVFEACHQIGRAIPEDISVVGVDNDRPFCNLCRPRLSSVEPNHEMVGYRAAQALEQLMHGESLELQVTEVNLHTLHPRLSSGGIAINDLHLLKALNYIREHASLGVSLDAVASAAGLSRSVLQRRFRQKLNHTVGEAILREKLRIAREMLTHTDLPISLVAERSGFNCQEYMNHIFKKHLQTTPRKYRLR